MKQSYISKHIKGYLRSKIIKRGGVYELNDGYSYQSLLTSNEEEADKQLEYLFNNCRISKSIIERAVHNLSIDYFLSSGKIINKLERDYAIFTYTSNT